jgi:branched-chain amino acid transport system substrate-binding protein
VSPSPGGGSAPGPKSPILLGTVGTYSGPVGSVFKPAVDAVQVWIRQVNDGGGLNGHPVRLFVYDDGGDPARQRAEAQDAIEQRKVIAFVQNSMGVSGQGGQDYINSKRIPTVGTDTGAPWVYDNPMIFPQTTSGPLVFQWSVWGAAQQTVPAGKTKFGILMCAEAAACDTYARVAAATAPKAGFQLVYQGRASLAQPDFTAECLNAHNAGAQVILVGMDGNSLGRAASSCARQDYKPVWASVSSLIVERQKSDPNLDGMAATSPVFPWFQSNTPAAAAFHDALKTYGGAAPSAGSAVGWVSAKLFEKAAAAMPEPPTSEAVLQGLWALRDETLGGLTQPLTFVENQPAPKVMCGFNFTTKAGAWVSADAFKLNCRQPEAP